MFISLIPAAYNIAIAVSIDYSSSQAACKAYHDCEFPSILVSQNSSYFL